jgi:hypothetical protein
MFGIIASVAIIMCIYFNKYEVYGSAFDNISFLQSGRRNLELIVLVQIALFLPLSFIIPITIMMIVEKNAPKFNGVAQYGGCLIQVITYVLSIVLLSFIIECYKRSNSTKHPLESPLTHERATSGNIWETE